MFVEDLTAFFSDAEFSVPCTLPSGCAVQVIFDEPHTDALGLMEASSPTAIGRTVDLADVTQGAEVGIGDIVWRVVGHQPDGTGITRLILERAP